MDDNVNTAGRTMGTCPDTESGNTGPEPAPQECGQGSAQAPDSRNEGWPPARRKKLHRTRAFFVEGSVFLGKVGDYTKRTYQEGKHIRSYLRCFRQCKTRKPWRRILLETLLVAWKWKALPFNYFMLALYDLSTPHNDKFLSFMPEPVLFSRYFPILSPPEYRILIHNKYFFHQLLGSFGIASPNLVVWSFDGTLYGRDGVILDDASLSCALESSVGDVLVFKPQNDARGHGIEFLAVVRDGACVRLMLDEGRLYGFKQLRAASGRMGDWLLQERVSQHADISAIYPHSVNTLRIVAINFPDGEIRILAALMRMGRNRSVIDNASAGGIHAHIDVEEGRLLAPAYCKTDNVTFAKHPDTGHPFAGVTLPFWREVLETVRRGTKLCMHTHAVAWDIAFTEAGPVVIEGNPVWGPFTNGRGAYPNGDTIVAAAEAWKANKRSAALLQR